MPDVGRVDRIATRMKILCIAPEHSDVLAVTSTLPELSRGVSLSWAHRFEDAAFWIFHNRDVAALVLDAQFGHEPCAALLANLHKRGLGAPTIVVADQASGTPNALGLGPDDCLLPRSTLVRDLPAAISRVIEKRQPAPPERNALKAQLARAEAALREVDARHASEIQPARDSGRRVEQTAAAAHLQHQLDEATKARRALEELIARERSATAARARDLSERLAQEVALREDADRTRTSLERTRVEADVRHATALAAAAEQVRGRDTQIESERVTSQTAYRTLTHQLQSLERARREAAETAVRDQTALANRFSEREHALGAEIARLAASTQALETRCADLSGRCAELDARCDELTARRSEAEAALVDAKAEARRVQDEATALSEAAKRMRDEAEQSAVRERQSAAERLAERERELEARAAATHEAQQKAAQAALTDLEGRLQAAEQARRDADVVAVQSAAREQALNAQLADAVAEQVQFAREASTRERTLQEWTAAEIDKRQALERALEEAARARDATAAEHASALAEVADRLAERDSRLDVERQAAHETRHAFERQLESAAQAQREALDRAAKDLALAVAHTARLQADLDAESRRAEDQRGVLEAQIGGLEAASCDAVRQHADAMAVVVAEAEQCRQQLETQLAELTAQLDARGRDLAEREAACSRLQEDVSAGSAESERLRRREAALLSHVDAESRARTIVEHERDDRTRQHEAAMQEAAQAYHALQRELDTKSAAHVQEAAAQAQEVDRLRGDLTIATRDVAATREERDALAIEAGHANRLQRDLDGLRFETAREFNQHPLPLLRCDLDGTLTRVNRAFAQMVGDASTDDAQRLTLAADLFTVSNDLRWLVERSRTAGVVTLTESALRTRDGRCLVVRLSSSASPSGAQVVVQDLTPQRVAQSTLDQARRLEAVGRLGTEVAVTSSQILREVYRDGERWLSAFDGTTAMRRRVELLLGDVARAAGHLDQLTAFGEQQATVIPSVDLHRVLHDMAPVLRQIAGDEIEILLPDRQEGSSALEVDVEADRVERLLVNVASYCRDRLPTGGSMRFELAPTIADRAFIEKYPAVRPGPHVVLTVAEVKGPIRLMGPSTRHEELAIAHDDASVPSGGVGVDLAALQALVRGCHGHLWVDAVASGDLTIRIHLPLKVV